MARQGKTLYRTDIVIGGKINGSLSKAVSTATGLLGKLSGSSALGGVSAKMGALSTVGIGLGAAGIAVTAAAKGIQATCNAAKEAVDAAKEYESAMADVAKVVDGLTDDEGKHTAAYTKMSKEILDLSTKIPMTAVEIAKIVEQGGQAGIEPENLVRYAESAAKMGVAFDTSAEQAGEWMAVWRASMSLPQDDVEALADQINYLGNTSTENARKISEVVTDVGSLGNIAGLSAGELAALAAATTGVEASVAGTGIKNLIVALSSGTAATKKQKAAFDKLGISAKKLSVRMQKDAQGAILDVLQAINKLPGSQQTAVIKDIFGKTSLETVAKLAGNVKNLQEQLDKINDPALYSGSMEKEFAARSSTYENQQQLWENTKEKFKINVGTIILESLNENLPGLISDVQESLDEVLPGLEQSLKEADIGQIVKDVAETIPSITAFIKDALPLVPGLLKLTLESLKGVVSFAKGLVEILDSIVGLISRIKNSTGKDWANVFFNPTGTMPTKTTSDKRTHAPKRSTSTQKIALPDSNGKLPDLQIPATPYATGGIVTQPTLALIGEGGENEAVIPLSKLDAMLAGSTTTNHTTQTTTFTFSPTIYVSGGDAESIREALDEGLDEAYTRFKQMMRQYERDGQRVRF